jgi:hypothetical protein
MARKRKSYGYIRLKNRRSKVARAKDRAENSSGKRVRVVGVRVFVQRGLRPTNYTDGAGYWAWACTSKSPRSGENAKDYSRLADHRRKACGEDAYGKTPTAAIKAALVKLGKKRELR